MPECMPGYPCFMQYSSNMFVAAMLDDLSLDPWPGLSDEELATYLLKERWGGPWARNCWCIFWIFLLIMRVLIWGDRMVVGRSGSSYQRRRSSTSRWHLDQLMNDFKCISSFAPGVAEVPTASVRSCELGCVCAAGAVRQPSGWIDTATGQKT